MAAPEDDEKPAPDPSTEPPARSEAKTEAFEVPQAPARDVQRTEAITVPAGEGRSEPLPPAPAGRAEPFPVLPGARKEPRFDDEPRSDVSEVSEVSGYYGRPHPTRNGLIVALVGASLGFIFACVSTSDFVQHLDRQVHAIHCSFIPGAGKEMGDSGCKTVMMSPYSSFFRESVWGGIPVSLWALAVFAYLVYRAALLLWKGKPDRAETTFLVASTLLPVMMTLIFAFLSMSKVGATCKVCVGIYFSSALVFVGALMAHRNNPAAFDPTPANSRYALWFGEGTAFVAVLTVTYLIFSPASDPKTSLTGCGTLVSGDDPAGVMLPLIGGDGEAAIEVLDPLCPSCKAFDTRLQASNLRGKLALKGVLFPLDSSCNWMVSEALHPGACAMSEALLCAAGLSGQKDEDAVHDMLKYAFKHQEELRTLAAKDEGAMRAKLEAEFPKVKGCLGTPLVKNKLTKSLRWAVANAIPVLTPQLFVGNARMCDEDTDLGLEYTLSRMLSAKGQKARAAVQPARPAKKPEAAP